MGSALASLGSAADFKSSQRSPLQAQQMWKQLTVLALLLVTSGSTHSAQTTHCITLRMEFPEQTREMSAPDGKGTTAVQIKHEDRYPTFYLDLTVRDSAAGVVGVSIRDDKDSDRVVDEFDLQIDHGAIQTATTPSFGLSVLRIVERVDATCGVGL